MPVISKRPSGLLSLFGINDLGAVPKQLTDQIVPTIDLTEFQLVDRESIFLGANFGAVGTAVLATVPTGELWRVHQGGLTSSALTINQRFAAGVMLANPVFTPISPIGRASQTGEILWTCCIQPFWAPAGSQFAVYVTDVNLAGGPNLDIELRMIFTRIRM